MGLYKPGSSRPIPLGEFAPDEAVNKPGILLDAVGAMPTQGGFSPMNNYAGLAPALAGRPMGSHFAYYSNGTTTLFVGIDTGSGLAFYTLDTSTSSWVSVTGPTVTPAFPLRFAQYGDDVLVVGKIATDGVWRAPNITGNFAAIVGSPPFATVITVINNQVLAFVEDSWFTSAAGDDTDWTLSLATRADTGVLTDSPGPVVAAVPLFRNAIVFKKNATYVGTQGFPSAFDWQLVSTSTGTWSQGCVIATPTAVYFLGIDDFYVITGYTPERIPNNVKQWFFRTVDPTYIDQTLGWFDEANSVLYWHFVSSEAPFPPTCDRFVSYNVRARRWCNGRLDVTSIPYLAQETNVLPNPGRPAIFIDGNFIASAFTVFPGNMVLTTGYMGDPGRLSQLMRVLPLYNRYPCQQTLTPLCTDVLGQPDKASEPAILGVDGWFYHRQYERFHKLVIGMTGDCEIFAFEPEFRAGGLWGYGVDVPCIQSRLSVESDLQPENVAGQRLVPEMTSDGVITGAPANTNLETSPTIALEVVCPPGGLPTLTASQVCCWDTITVWGGGSDHSGALNYVKPADLSWWASSGLGSGFSSGPYPTGAGIKWKLWDQGSACVPTDISATSAVPFTGFTADIEASQSGQAGRSGHSDEKSYMLTMSSVSPHFFNGSGNGVVYFGETSGSVPTLNSFNCDQGQCWTKYGSQIFATIFCSGSNQLYLARWPIPFANNYQDASKQCTSGGVAVAGTPLPGLNNHTTLVDLFANANYLYAAIRGSELANPKVCQINKSTLAFIQSWTITSSDFTNLQSIWVFSDSLIFLLNYGTPGAGIPWTFGILETASGTVTKLATYNSACTGPSSFHASNTTGFQYANNYFFIADDGGNVLQVGPLNCSGNPNVPWESV